MRETSPLRAIIYCRVSTDAQERDGTSLDTQERACVEYAQAKGWHVVERIRDTASGSTLDRPGIELTRQLLRQSAVDVVVSYAVDRLSRNQNHIGVLLDEVEQAGAHLDFVSEKFEDTAIGRFILAARAFVGEIEREKIAERTMRGKIERAKSGRLPQGTGKGMYGYTYVRETGKREIEFLQAKAVRRIFESYAESRSFSAVSNELNDSGIPAFSGGRWYPLTIRGILTNETYIGKTTYRRTKRAFSRNGNGKRISRIVEQPIERWVTVCGASPRIVDDDLWERVKGIINDPERVRRRPVGRFYPLGRRSKCKICGGAIVGQTLNVGGHRYRYYRCRHVYDRNTGRNCSSRYMRAEGLEQIVFGELRKLLTNPVVVKSEMERLQRPGVDAARAARLKREVAQLAEREKRLVRLYGLGAVDESVIREEAADLRAKREVIEKELGACQQTPVPLQVGLDTNSLAKVCAAVGDWLDNADEEGQALALEALQVELRVSPGSAILRGVVPADVPEFITDEGSCRYSFNGDKSRLRHGVPFSVRFSFLVPQTACLQGLISSISDLVSCAAIAQRFTLLLQTRLFRVGFLCRHAARQ